MVRRAASNMRKDLTCTKVLEIIMQPDPSSELQYVLSQITDYNCCKGSVENLHHCMCHYTFVSTCILFSVSVSCSCPSRHKSTDSSRHQQLRSEKGNMQVVQRTKKKEHSALASVVVDTLAKSTKWYAASPAGKTEHTHTHPHPPTHTDTH